MNNELIQYIIALCNLYGMVHKRKVVEIYNQQNTDQVTTKDIELLQENVPEEVDEAWIEVHKGYFVSGVILEHHEFLYYLREKENKPYYVPRKEELLNYADGFYWEKNQEFYRLVNHLKKYFSKDSEKAVDVAGDVQLLCQFDYKLDQILDRMEQMGVVFKNDVDIQKTLQFVVELKNNTRIWENNGYSHNELREIMDLKLKQPVSALSVAYPGKSNINYKGYDIGRNDPCLCGSWKKYKNCCLKK